MSHRLQRLLRNLGIALVVGGIGYMIWSGVSASNSRGQFDEFYRTRPVFAGVPNPMRPRTAYDPPNFRQGLAEQNAAYSAMNDRFNADASSAIQTYELAMHQHNVALATGAKIIALGIAAIVVSHFCGPRRNSEPPPLPPPPLPSAASN